MTYLHRLRVAKANGQQVDFLPQIDITPPIIRVGQQGGGMGEMTTTDLILTAGQLAGVTLGAYHGYKRNSGSVGMAIGWSLLGGLFWPVTIPIMLAQGLGKRK